MSFIELLLIAVGLSADAFSVSVCKGLSAGADLGQSFTGSEAAAEGKNISDKRRRSALLCGLWFGGFQFLMPVIGYILGSRFLPYIEKIDHWIAFLLLAGIGVNMIRESFSDDETQQDGADRTDAATMAVLAVATSIDALIVGVSFGLLSVNILAASSFIGCCTFLLSAVGVLIGNRIGERFSKRAETAGGVILILIGLRILLQHLFGI